MTEELENQAGLVYIKVIAASLTFCQHLVLMSGLHSDVQETC